MKYLYGLAELQPADYIIEYKIEGVLIREDKWKVPIFRKPISFLLEFDKISKIEVKIDTQINYKMSAGKAIAVGALTGGVGTLVGGMIGSKKKDTSKYIIIRYFHEDLGEIEVIFEDKYAEKTQSKLLKMKIESVRLEKLKQIEINQPSMTGTVELSQKEIANTEEPKSTNFWKVFFFGWFFLIIGVVGFFGNPIIGLVFIGLGVYMIPKLKNKVNGWLDKNKS
jgi:hypothetical protein